MTKYCPKSPYNPRSGSDSSEPSKSARKVQYNFSITPFWKLSTVLAKLSDTKKGWTPRGAFSAYSIERVIVMQALPL